MCLKRAQVLDGSLVTSGPNGRPMADHDAASAAERRRMRRLRCHWRREQLSMRMAVAAAVHHSRDRTINAVDATVLVGGCVEMVQVISRSRLSTISHSPVNEGGTGSGLHSGTAREQTVDFAVPPTREDLAEASEAGAHP